MFLSGGCLDTAPYSLRDLPWPQFPHPCNGRAALPAWLTGLMRGLGVGFRWLCLCWNLGLLALILGSAGCLLYTINTLTRR